MLFFITEDCDIEVNTFIVSSISKKNVLICFLLFFEIIFDLHSIVYPLNRNFVL